MVVAAFFLTTFVVVAQEVSQGLRGSQEEADTAFVGPQGRRRGSEISLDRPFVLRKDFDLGGNVSDDFDVQVMPDAEMTHSCANYTGDGTTVFARDGSLVLKVASACPGGKCLNSGRVMSKDGFRYGVFIFKATIPKCNYIWPALWLLPSSAKGDGEYGTWPCSGEIDLLETVHEDPWGAFNLVAGFGAHEDPQGFCARPEQPKCSCSAPGYCTSTTLKHMRESFYYVEPVDCTAEHPSWSEHTFVLYWQPDQIASWVDPELTFDDAGNLVDISAGDEMRTMNIWGENMEIASWKAYERSSTPTWANVRTFMDQCFPDVAGPDAPFDKDFKIVLNIAIGGYSGSPCVWNSETCTSKCGGAVGSELIVSELKVYQ